MADSREVFGDLSQESIDAQDDTKTWLTAAGILLLGRIWLARDADSRTLEGVFIRAASVPDGGAQVASTVSKSLSPASPGGNYAARRIVQTEANRAYGRATRVASRANPLPVVMKWVKSANHKGDDICDKNAAGSSRGRKPGEYLISEFPPYPGHPNCQCMAIPVIIDAVDEAVANILRNLDM